LIVVSYLFISDKIQLERIETLENKINEQAPVEQNNDRNKQTKIINKKEDNSTGLIDDNLNINPNLSDKNIKGGEQEFKLLDVKNTRQEKQTETKIKSSSLIQQITPSNNIQNSFLNKEPKSNSNPSSTPIDFALMERDKNFPVDRSSMLQAKKSSAVLGSAMREDIDLLNPISKLMLTQIQFPINPRPFGELDQEAHVNVDKKRSILYGGLSTRYNYWLDHNSGIIDNPLEGLLEDESTLASWAYGASIGIELNQKWTANVELLYNQRSHQSTYLIELPYSTSNETLDNEGDYINDFQHSLPTSLGDVQTDVTLSRIQTSMIEDDELVGIDLAFRNQTESLIVPVNAAYYPSGVNRGIYFSGGLVNEIFLNSKLSGIQSNSHHSGVHNKSVNVQYDDTQQNKYGLGASAGIGYVWNLYANTSLKLGVNYDFALTDNYNFSGYEHKTNNLSFGLSIIKPVSLK